MLLYHTFSLTCDDASQYHVGCMQVYEGQWQGQTVAIKVLDGAAAASQKAMKEVSFQVNFHCMLHLVMGSNREWTLLCETK